jgi:AcrR family transcriptional regulator
MKNSTNNNKLAWLRVGIKTIDTEGLSELKISKLCHKLNVTKGSFYHWFKSKEFYKNQLLEYWKHLFTQEFIKQAEQGQNSKQKLSLLCRQCIDGAVNGNRLEFEINAWSQVDETVKKFVYSVYKKRYQYLIGLLSNIYTDEKEVKKQALTLYSLVVGIDFFYRKLTIKELELIFSEYLITH